MSKITKVKQKLIDYGVYPAFADWLEEMEMPFFRKPASKRHRKWPWIEIGGDSMRIGKTTAMEVLGKSFENLGLPVVLVDEDWQSNPHLVASYGDSSDTILKSQKWFAKRKFEQLQGRGKDSVWFQCVHPEMDYCYAATNVLLGRLTLKQFEKYTEFYNSLGWGSVPAPDLLVYLTASEKVLADRVLKVAREFEKVDATYFWVMSMVNQVWIDKGKGMMDVLVVNTDNFDFSLEKKAKQQLFNKVYKKLTQQGWQSKAGKTTKDKNDKDYFGKVLKSKLVIMCGMPGSGKSYLARRLAKEYDFVRLTSDAIRIAKYISKGSKSKFDKDSNYEEHRLKVYGELHQKVSSTLKKGSKVVIDAIYLGPQRDRLLGLLKEEKLVDDVIMFVVKADRDIIEKRVRNKARRVKKEKDHFEGWKRDYNWFHTRLVDGEIRYPDEKLDGIKIVEIWNQ